MAVASDHETTEAKQRNGAIVLGGHSLTESVYDLLRLFLRVAHSLRQNDLLFRA